MYHQQTIMLPQRQFCFNLEDMSRLRIQLARCFMYVRTQVKDVQGIQTISQGNPQIIRPASQPPMPTQPLTQPSADPSTIINNAMLQQQQQQQQQQQMNSVSPATNLMFNSRTSNDNLKAPPNKRARTSPQPMTQQQPIDLSPSPAPNIMSTSAPVNAPTPPKSPYSVRNAALAAARGSVPAGRGRGRPQARPRNASQGSRVVSDSNITNGDNQLSNAMKTPTGSNINVNDQQKPTALEDPVTYLENALAEFKNNFQNNNVDQGINNNNSIIFNALKDEHQKPSLTLEDVQNKPEPEFILSPDNIADEDLAPDEELDFSLLLDESSFDDNSNKNENTNNDNKVKANEDGSTPELINGTNPSPESINDELKSPTNFFQSKPIENQRSSAKNINDNNLDNCFDNLTEEDFDININANDNDNFNTSWLLSGQPC